MPTSSMPASQRVLLGPGKVNPAVGRPMVGFLKKLERTDVPFLQAAEILYGQGARFTFTRRMRLPFSSAP